MPEMQQVVDMRSDTVTKPTAEMYAAMSAAEVGDDVMGEDPTINALEARAAELFGKEAALFVPTGTMGNLTSVLVHCEARASEVILGSECHIYIWEQGGIATLGGVHPRVVPNLPDGTLDLQVVEAMIRPVNDHFPTTKLLAIEQTHNGCGGRVLPLKFIDDAAELCRRRGLKLHMDGARIFNACAALGVTPARMVRDVDSASVCLSKGLASPVGSLIVSTAEFITKARRLRKALGGGMRQAGVLAACGLLSLDKMSLPDRLTEDHSRAKAIANSLSNIPGLKVDIDCTQSNLVLVYIVDTSFTAQELVDVLKTRGTLVLSPKPDRIRVALHYQIDDAAVVKAVADFKESVHELQHKGEPDAKRLKV